ncbi:MAG TPA: FAD-linked oxidase C-terminal domain-containing protein [Chloroflexota bacterium]|nr:FAD-linked oxidase C-terminal domain-containing protein [Chloroflexota bacterium]
MLRQSTLDQLSQIVGPGNLLTTREDLAAYAYDATPRMGRLPDAVVKPGTTEEVSRILQMANREGFKVVPRGAGTNLSGGTVPIQGGVVMQLTRLNRVLEVDTENLTALVEPGVITSDLHATVEAIGLFYPPDPGSMTVSTMGGNVAENAGGLRGLKYGVTKDYVIGMEVVLPTGEVITTGGKTVKNVTGYDLTKLMVGSEGTLGVITKILVRLIPKPEAKKTMLVFYRSLDDAAQTVSAIIANRVIPPTLEFLDNVTIRCVEQYIHAGLPLDMEAMLLIEVDGSRSVVEEDSSKVLQVCREHHAAEIQVAETAEDSLRLATGRRAALPALARIKPTMVLEDATVPRSQVAAMVRKIQGIAEKYDLLIGTFGHAGDGNLHPTILCDERDTELMERVDEAVDEMFRAALELGGTLSGEHGIGLAKAPYMPLELKDAGMKAMIAIKKALDPNNILNPGKMYIDQYAGWQPTGNGHGDAPPSSTHHSSPITHDSPVATEAR